MAAPALSILRPVLLVAALASVAGDLNAASRTVTLRHRVVHEQLSQPFPHGRSKWSEAVVTRMTVGDDGSIRVEGATSRSYRDAISAQRRNGDTVDAGGYTVTYTATPSEWFIRSDYPTMTLKRSVRFLGSDSCVARVDYDRRGGQTLALPNTRGGTTEFASIRAADVTCRVEGAASVAPTRAICDVDARHVPQMYMRVSIDGACAWRPREGVFRRKPFVVVEAPRHGNIEIGSARVVYRPAAGYVGTDGFMVRGVRTGEGPPERRFDVEVLR